MCNCKGYNFVIKENIIKILNMEIAGLIRDPRYVYMVSSIYSATVAL